MSSLLRSLCFGVGLLMALLAAPGALRAQSTAGFGDWQLHLPTNRAQALADAGDRIYVATSESFFYFDKNTSTTTLLSSRDGLNGVGVAKVAYDSVSRQVLVAYQDANLDLLSPDASRIRNVSDIQRKTITGSKRINHINFSGRYAYLSCDFGLLVLDMQRLEVRDTYANIGPSGQQIIVWSSTVAGNFIFAATEKGVMRASLTANLADYRSWTLDIVADAPNRYMTMATFNGQAYVGRAYNSIYRYVPGTGWQEIYNYAAQYVSFTPSRAGLLVVDNEKLLLLSASGTFTSLQNPAVPQPQAALRSRDGAIYVADYQRGLLRTTDRRNYEQFVANGPQNRESFGLLADAASNTVDVFTGGFNADYSQQERRGGFYEYKDGRWTNYTKENYPSKAQYPNLKDLTRGARTADGTLYVGSYGQGLLRWRGLGDFQQDSAGNSPLLSAIPGLPYVRVTDVAAAPNGDVWVASRHPEQANRSGLHVLSPRTNTWRTIPYYYGFDNLDRIVLDDLGNVWMSQARKLGQGLMAYQASATQPGAPLYFTQGSGGLPSSTVYALAKDRKGDIWVTTDKGVATFSDPSSAFVSGGTFTLPYVDGFPALGEDVVRAVAIDGGNRKWFGTDRGLWLFNPDVTQGLLHFTTDNSPLPSNRIIDVAVNDKTGEVFVATDAGLVAYRGSATVTEGKPSCAKVSPNPVRTNFQGQVGVSGLTNNAIVKITDVTGKLVYQTTANGGTVTWNLADYNGRKVQSGVYLVLSSDANGENGCVSKIAVVEQ